VDRSSKYYPIRRSTRLSLKIPLLVTSLNPKVRFSEHCTTVIVNAHGCGITAPRALDLGTRVGLVIASTKQTSTASVVEAVPLDEHQQSWLLGLALDKPGNFWGIRCAPSDWQAEQLASETPTPNFNASVKTPHHVTPKAAENVPSRSHAVRPPVLCRLTALSSGACYVQSSRTFPRLARVRVRVSGIGLEHIFVGTVCLEHAQSGMGIEFNSRDPHHHNRIECLIRDLNAREDIAPLVEVENRPCESDLQTVQSSGTPEFHDSLLALVLLGSALNRADFLRELERQRRSRH
jgi:hypothetical protein